jgi:dihydrofolate reductase
MQAVNHPEIILVLARARNGTIGANGTLPWRIPADLRHFKQITKNKPMIMGRTTFESLPGLLPGRRHIVLTRDADFFEDGVEVVHSFEEALRAANAPHVAIIGGAQIYALALPMADRIELTEVDADFDGDTHVPAFDPEEWEEVSREAHEGQAGHGPSFAFVRLVRRIKKNAK